MMCSWMRLFPLFKLPESSDLRRVAALVAAPKRQGINSPYRCFRSRFGSKSTAFGWNTVRKRTGRSRERTGRNHCSPFNSLVVHLQEWHSSCSCRCTRGTVGERTDLLQGTLDLLILKTL